MNDQLSIKTIDSQSQLSVANRQSQLSSPSQLFAGQVLGPRYEIEKRLGNGGMSEVWLAHDRVDDRRVALKLLNSDLATQPGYVNLFYAEAAKLRSLLHPGVVQLISQGKVADRHFLVLEYLPGVKLLKLRGANWQTVLRTMISLADTLEYVHSQGIVHRDLKAGNVIFSAAGNPKLIDFGIAGTIAGIIDTHPTPQPRGGGSLPAMSPQQLSGGAPAISDDIYGFGALIYELISGAPLFTPGVTEYRVRTEVPTPLAQLALGEPIPTQLGELVGNMLAKQPDRRPSGIRAVRERLERCMSDDCS